MAGRPRKPAATRKREGNRGKRKIPEEPSYAGELPPPPKFITKTGLREWRRLGPMMVAQGVLTAADWSVFVQYCHAVGRKEEIEDARANEKIGSAEWNQLDRAFDRCEKQLSKAQTELGITPVTRSKAAREQPKQADELEQFDGFKPKVVQGGRK